MEEPASEAPHEPDARPDRERARVRRRLWWLAVPIVLVTAAVWIGTAFAPALAVHAPLALLLLCPAWRHLLLVALELDAATYFALGLARMFLPNPLYYQLGRDHGPRAIHWVEERSGRSGRVLRRVERLFARFGPFVVLVAPIGTVSALAGASGLRPRLYLTLNLAGNAAQLVGVRLVAAHFGDEVRSVLAFVAERVPLLTIVSVALVVLVQGLQWRRSRTPKAPPGP
ncbi:MAG: hypothetical protein IT373_21505 [Polyangiaceae bacterium]|nr:hypothetical protein [Polyangiaceae bacterium]